MEEFRLILRKIQDCIELQNGATEGQLKDLWNDLSNAITNSELKILNIPVVSQRSELLNAFFEYLDSLHPKEYDANSLTGHGKNWLKSI